MIGVVHQGLDAGNRNRLRSLFSPKIMAEAAKGVQGKLGPKGSSDLALADVAPTLCCSSQIDGMVSSGHNYFYVDARHCTP